MGKEREENEKDLKLKPVTFKNIAHGQVEEAFNICMKAVHDNIQEQPDADHEFKITVEFVRNEETGVWMTRPKYSYSCKTSESKVGLQVPIHITSEGFMQPTAGKQLTLDSLNSEEEE